ncbi:MBL fold metallo-hydrolase [Lacihabitans sp. LS3-19]|uniref:MBL fold metallo-hydrolase n=1 Tax=Lacihabitans sp. LS3-19 TaxID=2487335 RepID=UPI0020CC0515|nr:MBL fold metallo-hydrolase [Lacihabitans sp. LS3-19]MCP9766916.1 MBL fold metallo-hydrolase [Lacihabitans sp. LS3-19]
MTKIKSFVFSPFSENSYVLYDETLEAVIIDPGCLSQAEKLELKDFIVENKLKVKALLLTHAHLDHVFGAAFVKRTFDVEMYLHDLDLPILADVEMRCKTWGIPGYEPVEADKSLNEGESFTFGNTKLEIIHVPGHAPGHVAFICHQGKFIMGGDCLFHRSIGRTDFPGCSHEALIHSIKTKFFTLPDEYTVYAGHMQPTTIGAEKQNNPFLK